MIALLAWLLAGQLMAEIDRVRVFLAEHNQPAKEDAYWVGQKVSIIVEVLSETHFSGSTRLSLPDVAGSILYKPEERAIVSSRQINADTFSVQRHELSFYPQRAATFKIPAFGVSFGVAGKPGTDPIEFQQKTDPLTIKAILPPGAENLSSLITSTKLEVSESWTPDLAGLDAPLTAGNAIKRRITFRASDMPGMAFPRLPISEPEGIKVYRNRAEVEDQINRGSLTGQRVDSLTYVCQEAGDYTLPALQITWWDINQQQLKTITLPERHFSVNAAAHTSADAENVATINRQIPWLGLMIVAAFLSSIGYAFYRYRARLLAVWIDWKHRRNESEEAYFKRITPDLPPGEMHSAVNQWFIRMPNESLLWGQGNSLDRFFSGQQYSSIQQEWESLQAAVVGKNPNWHGSQLVCQLRQTRKIIQQQQKTGNKKSKIHGLVPLNPKSNRTTDH